MQINEEEMMVDRLNQRFGDYQLVRYLGKGGFGEVYLGQHVYDKSQAAIKLLKTTLKNETDHKEFVSKLKEFINEASTFNLDHPNIVKLLAFGMGKDDAPFLAFAYAPNGSLRDCHQRGESVPLQIVLTYVKQIAAGLQYAHDHRRIHRDVKPENMLLGANNEVLISDFGIATFAHSTESWEEQKQTGTPYYMAPEQIMRQAQPGSDQYSLAVVVYEWLCGSLPFKSDQFSPREIQQMQLMNQHLKDEPPSLCKRNPNISSAVEQVVLKALAKMPQNRFDNIMAFAIALERAAIGKGIPPVKPSPAPVIPQTLPDPIEQLFQEGVRAHTHAMRAHSHENAEKAFDIWRQIMMAPGVDEQYRITARNSIQELRTQMIPLRLKQARKACLEGHWQDEIRWWEDLLALEPSEQDLAPLVQKSLTLGTYFTNNLHSVRERLRIAQQNFQFVSMYSGVKQHIHNNNIDYARDQLQILWRDAPYYGDPEKLAQSIGLPAAMNYEQALFVEEKRKRQALAAEKERERQALATEKERERQKQLEQEKERVALLKQEDEIEEQERNKHILMIIIGTIVLLGAGVEGVRVGIWGVITGAVETVLGAGVVITGAMAVGVLAGVLAVVLAAVKDEDEIFKGVCTVLAIVTGSGGLVLAIVTGLEGEIVFGIMEGVACILLAIAVYWATVFTIIVVFGILYGITYTVVFMILKVLEAAKSISDKKTRLS